MPGRLSKRDEKKWRKAKKIVQKQKGKKPSKFTDRDWGLTTHIFKAQKKSDFLSEITIAANALDKIGQFELANQLDELMEIA